MSAPTPKPKRTYPGFRYPVTGQLAALARYMATEKQANLRVKALAEILCLLHDVDKELALALSTAEDNALYHQMLDMAAKQGRTILTDEEPLSLPEEAEA